MASLLEKIHSPEDIKGFGGEELDALCEEMRRVIIETVSANGGHLASNLGVVELTVSLALAFSPPRDTIVWDVGHQSYPYKLLTGRYPQFSTIRLEGGLAGFPCREESEYDKFTSGHSSASISAALGVSEANFLQGKEGYVVAVIGDGALTGGLAYEGLNNAGRLHRNLIVILNDNTMSISKNVGSMARYLSYIRTKPGYIKTKNRLERTLRKIPGVGPAVASGLRSLKRSVKRIFYNSTIFEDMGFAYYGPFDGHNIKELAETLETAKLIHKPVLLHIRTYKGKGYQYAEQDPTIYHGLSGFDVTTGDTGAKSQSFSDEFGQALCSLARENPKLCAITAAMQNGTGLTAFREEFRSRFFDVGISEEHAVTFAGGLAAGGMLPVFAVYSTFLQRAYDELIHDVSMQNTKVILAIDRAGVVGEDGKTHQGVFDAAYLQTIPNVTVYSPAYFKELRLQLAYLVEQGNGLCAIRYPRGRELYKPAYFKSTTAPYSVYGSEDAAVCLVTYGRVFSFAAECKEHLEQEGLPVKLLKLNRIIPLDGQAVQEAFSCREVFFLEEGVQRGGIGNISLICWSSAAFPAVFTFGPFKTLHQARAHVPLVGNAGPERPGDRAVCPGNLGPRERRCYRMKKRLDILVTERGLAESREKAKTLIMAGQVYVDGQKADKPGDTFSEDAAVEVRGKGLPYVSRGGLKLEKAMREFGLQLQGCTCMDIGASTGGFTDCMLQNGAQRVYSVDVGYGQLAWSLRTDPRVVNLERTNARYLTREQVPEEIGFFSVDVSFISLTLILPAVRPLLAEHGQAVCLIAACSLRQEGKGRERAWSGIRPSTKRS